MYAMMAAVRLDIPEVWARFEPATSFALVVGVILGVVTLAPWSARWRIYRRTCRVGRPVPRTRWSGAPPSEDMPIPLPPGWFVGFNLALMGLASPALAGTFARSASALMPGMSLGLVAWLSLALGVGLCWTVVILVLRIWWRANGRAV
jgi:hypothetical protein